MEITITWTKIIVLVARSFTGRYLYYSYLKWHTGSPDPFDPTEYCKTSSYTRGLEHGLHSWQS